MRPDAEETEEKTKASDSGYSNSCNSQSRSCGSSKSINSTSSGSSGTFENGVAKTDGDKSSGKKKDKEHKKKKKEPKESSGKDSQQPSTSLETQPTSTTAGEVPTTTQGSREGDGSDLQSSALSQTLSTLKRINSDVHSPDVENSRDMLSENNTDETPDEVKQLFNKETTHEEEIGIVVSMDDGVVEYTTPTLTQVLGYPMDMWIGRSLIDFVHPRHRAAFAGQITTIIANSENNGLCKNYFSCYLRQYRGLLRTGYSVTEKRVGYLPFQLIMNFKDTGGDCPRIFLVISAIPIRSSYTRGDEKRKSTKFTTRHTASLQICHVDPEVTFYFGYLPQDILGRSILEFYHPEDLHFLKEVYEAVMKDPGHPFRSKPYRFRCQNGGFALVETELSSFINPWSHRLEFIICQHAVLRGPPNPDVTTPIAVPATLQISEEILKESKIVQEEIKCLLNETVVKNSESAKQQVTKRCKDLAAFMENLMDELTKPPELKVDVPTEEQSFSERDSVMLGEISPHHEYYDSKSSTETPPSYNQLNYNENIQRFFESKPKTTMSDESSDSKIPSSGEEGKISPVNESIEDSKSGGSGGSSGAQSTESNANSGETNTSSNNKSAKNYQPAILTEHLLLRHNEDMEKRMVQKHREQRSKSDTNKRDRIKTIFDNPREDCGNHGIKRSGSHSWEGEPYKSIKAAHNTNDNHLPLPREREQPSAVTYPSFNTQLQEYPQASFANTLLPMFYIPDRRPDVSLIPQQIPYVPSMVYHPVVFSPQPLVYSPVAMIPAPAEAALPSPAPPVDPIPSPLLPPEPITVPSTSKSRESLAQDRTESNGPSLPFDDSSSSFYSLLKTDKSDESLKSSSENETKQDETDWRHGKRSDGKMRRIKKVAPWIEDINVTPELVLKYQLRERPLEEVLYQDLLALKNISQPGLVSEQLSQMYIDLELEGLDQQVILEEESWASSDSSGDETKEMRRQQKKYMEFDKMAILFEEDAPLPPPIVQSCT